MEGYPHASLPQPQVVPNGRQVPSIASDQRLPLGRCGFRELSSTSASQTCGCRRFWLNHAASSQRRPGASPPAPSMETAWCFCGHHACYHDWLQTPTPKESCLMPTDYSYGNTHRSLTPSGTAWRPAYTQPSHHLAPALGLFLDGGRQPKRLMPTSPSGQTFYDSQMMPPIQESPRPPSDISSTPAPPLLRQSPTRAFLTHIETRRKFASGPEIAPSARQEPPDDCVQSATEAATPSQFGDAALQEADDAVHDARICIDTLAEEYGAESHQDKTHACQPPETSPKSALVATAQSPVSPVNQLLAHVQTLRHILSSRPSLISSISDLDKRLDALETMSYNHGSMDEINERIEHFDGRLLEIEGKLDEVERHQSVPVEGTARSKPVALSATNSAQSFDSEMTDVDGPGASVQPKINHLQRLVDLEQRLTDLEASELPNLLHPWAVEVVLLPWGHDLKGIWATESEASQVSRLPTQESAGHSSSNTRKDNQQSASERQNIHTRSSSRHYISPEWPDPDRHLLWARACAATSGTGGRVYQRLQSRGFVRTVVLCKNDARNIHNTICETFADILDADQMKAPENLKISRRIRRSSLFGLESPFIPLRKIHKSSRLRFLAIPELASPLLWTGDFLDADIFMKAPAAGLRRLFITMPNAYFQSTKHRGWTWQKIRELPRTDLPKHTDSESEVLEGNAIEPCWAWDAKLDTTPASAQNSFVALESFQKHASFTSSHPLSPEKTEWLSDSDPDCDSNSDSDSESAEVPVRQTKRPSGPVTPVSAAAPAGTRRTVSVPVLGRTEPVGQLSSATRQISSFEPVPPKAPQKRPRASPSSEDIISASRGRWALTPRRSREPGSPTAGTIGRKDTYETLSSGDRPTAVFSKRAVTPSAYATPFSNSFAPIGGLGNSWTAGDTDMDSSSDDDDNEAMDENPDTEFDDAYVTNLAFDKATMLEEDAWEGVGGDATDDENKRQHDPDHDASSDDEAMYITDHAELAESSGSNKVMQGAGGMLQLMRSRRMAVGRPTR